MNFLGPNNHPINIFQAVFQSNLKYFDFDTDMDPWPAAKSFAKESWSKEYFRNIEK